MEDLEILAKLKIAYLALEDIMENSEKEQLESKKELENIQEILSAKYEEVFKNATRNIKTNLKYMENIEVSAFIDVDYYDIVNKKYLGCGDLRKEWWNDIEFLRGNK